MEYSVEIWEDSIQYNESGKITHHPINSCYQYSSSSSGYLSFAGSDLDKSNLMGDLRYYYLEFWTNPEDAIDEGLWATPLRAEVLKSLAESAKSNWYISFYFDKFENILSKTRHHPTGFNFTSINSVMVKFYGGREYKRIIMEIPINLIARVLKRFWHRSTPGYPIEGYLMEPNSIGMIDRWNSMKRDDVLFREVMDFSKVVFYTYPAENRDFVFITHQYSLDEFSEIIRLPEIQEKAKRLINP